MINEVIELLEKYCDGKGNIDKVEISVLQLHRIIKALEQQTCGDAVSRKDVLNLVDNLNDGSFRWASIRTKIARLHLVQPELEPCEDAVSRQAVEKITWEEPSYTDALNVLTEVREKIRQLPSVNPQPICEEREKGECPYYAG